ncbi:MAG: NAD(P)-binding protein [Thermodesulfobacteriota bacterium]|nr:NAD(P)-binding protein [Candidatus Dadabacteria bacterium]|tara:strand:- start:9734 stop:10690 length:957 start_codon:yes stop_codon:yes gene_type:complete
MKKISIIGTGLSAIFSAIHLRKNTDLEINLFDKARGLGGRLATRRAEDGKFDHGAQYFSIERISNLPEIQMLINEGIISNIEDKDIYFSPDGMTNIAKKLLMDFNIFKEHKLVSIDKENENYKLFFENGSTFNSDYIIMSCPMPQSLEILNKSKIDFDNNLIKALEDLNYFPCIVVMIKSEIKLSNLDKHIGTDVDSKNISWIGDNYRKKVSSIENYYTIQCSPEFSYENFENEYDETNEKLKHDMEKIFGSNYQILSNHKWRYSIPKNFYQEDNSLVINEKDFLGLCGDIFTNGRFDGAITSGLSIADKFLKNELQK